jgi:hypothetical protein
VLLIGCGAPTAEERERAAAMHSSKDDPSSQCLLYGYSEGAAASTEEGALENLKVEAARRDGNFVVPESFNKKGGAVSARGRVYVCPDWVLRAPAPATTTTPPPPKPVVCVPDCSPGYVCIEGKCISACNPLCEPGQRCGADRICHKATD